MEDFRKRLEVEASELKARIGKLEAFLEHEKSYNINPIQRDLLKIQVKAMQAYDEVLTLRINMLAHSK